MSAVDGRESSATHSSRFTHRNTARGQNRAASSVVSVAGVDTPEKRKDLSLLSVIEPQFFGRPSSALFTTPTELTRIVNRNGCGILQAQYFPANQLDGLRKTVKSHRILGDTT
jgi:hypothetical protein